MLAARAVSAAALPPRRRRRRAAREGARSAFLPFYTRAQNYKSLKQSSYDRTGGNRDRWPIAAGGVQEIFNATGPGVITHIWFTIAARGADHLKELVLRGYWDGNAKPSVEAPIGDFFGLNLGIYQIYESRVSGVFAGAVAELLFRDAVQAIGAVHGDERGEQAGGGVLFEHRLHLGAEAAGRCGVFPCAVPAGDAERAR